MDLTLPGSGRTVTQTFSVFDYDTGKFRYYAAPMTAPPLTGHYRVPRGSTPESMAVPLPPDARVVGEGSSPKGMIATVGGLGSVESSTSAWPKVAVAALVLTGVVLWRRRRSR